MIYPRTRRSGIINASEAGSLARALHSSTWDARRWDRGGLVAFVDGLDVGAFVALVGVLEVPVDVLVGTLFL